MRRRARSSSMNIASPRSLDGAESADDSSIMSPSGQQKVSELSFFTNLRLPW